MDTETPALMMLQQHMPELDEIAHDDHQGKRQILDEVLRRGVAEGRWPPASTRNSSPAN